MPDFEPRTADFEACVRTMIVQQPAMELLGAEITVVEPGRTVLALPFDQKLTQHNGFLHAGFTTTMLDTAAGCAAYTLMEADANVLTVEFKVNLLAPGRGERFEFHAEVLKPGRTITVVEAKGYAFERGAEKLFASMSATMIATRG